MIVLRNKDFSTTNKYGTRAQAGARGIMGGLGSSLGVGSVIGLVSGENIKQKVVLSIAATLLSLPFTLYSGYKAGVGMWDMEEKKKQQAADREARKEQRKLEAERKEKEELDKLEALKNSLISTFPEIDGLSKIAADKTLDSLHPNFGDGDEYPTFYLRTDIKNRAQGSGFVPVLVTSFQDESVGINPEKGWWCTEDRPNQKINLKQYLLKYYKNEKETYINAKRDDSFAWEEEDYDQVIKYTSKVIELIQKNL